MQQLHPEPAATGTDAAARHGSGAKAVRAEVFDLIKARSFGRGRIVLASGKVSDFYFDLKPTMLHAVGAAGLAELIVQALDGVEADYIGGPEMGAVPLIGAISQLSLTRGRPLNGFFVRKVVKDHGAKKSIEGLSRGETLRGKRVVILEDVTTTGDSAMRAIEAVRAEGADIVLILSIVDRQDGARERFAQNGLPFRWLFCADEFLNAAS